MSFNSSGKVLKVHTILQLVCHYDKTCFFHVYHTLV